MKKSNSKPFEEYFKRQFHIIYTIGAILSIVSNVIDILTIKNRDINMFVVNSPVIIVQLAAYILYLFKQITSKQGILIIAYSLIMNIVVTQIFEPYHDTFIIYFLRASIFFIIILTITTLVAGRNHALYLLGTYYIVYILNLYRTKDSFFTENIYTLLLSFFLIAFLIYVFSDHLRAVILALQEKSNFIEEQNKKLTSVNQKLEYSQEELHEVNIALEKQNKILEKREVQLKSAISAKDKFISIIAHDLKNPTNTLKGFLEMLHKKIGKVNEEKLLDYIMHAKESSEQLNNLLVDLLEWSRTQNETIKFEPNAFSAKLLSENVVDFLKLSALEKKIEILNLVDEDIIYADYDMLFTVIRNLVSNSIKFSHENSKIKIVGRLSNSWFNISVEDKGVGMDESTINKIFQLDANVSSQGTKGETGTGLGLKITKELIEIHKGEITVESFPDKGTTISVSIPQNEFVKPSKTNHQ